jgi:hypothetical protein
MLIVHRNHLHAKVGKLTVRYSGPCRFARLTVLWGQQVLLHTAPRFKHKRGSRCLYVRTTRLL